MAEIALQLSDEQLASILAEGKQQILDAVEEAIVEHLTWQARDEIAKELTPIIRTFMQEEIIPEVVELLAGQKSAILKQVVIQANEIGVIFVRSLVAQLTERLGQDYKRKQIFEAIFK